jgi:hypothetical protein
MGLNPGGPHTSTPTISVMLSLIRSDGGSSPLPLLRSPKMAPPYEDLTRLLADLAARFSSPPAAAGGGSRGSSSTVAADALPASISSLAGALNPSSGRVGAASSRTRVLDTVLSLMCFDPLEARITPPRHSFSIAVTATFSD